MLNTTLTLTAALNVISSHAPEAFTKSQVTLLESLAFEIESALQERHLAAQADEAICDQAELMLVGESDQVDAHLSHSHNCN
jgi:GAF domain-containing protein